MSYKQAVLRDNPLSFWPLDGNMSSRTYSFLTLTYPTYQAYLSAEANYAQELLTQIQDASNYGNHGAVTSGTLSFQDVAPLISHSTTDTNFNGCFINSSIGFSIANNYGPNFSAGGFFQKGYEQKTFAMEFWLLMPGALNLTCNIINLQAGANNRMQVYTNNDFIYFTVYFSNGSSVTTKKQIYSWDYPLHIFAIVKDKKISIYVNNLSDETVSIPTSYQFYSDSSTVFNVGPASTSAYFTINGLAFYDRVLSTNEIKNHMFWAHKDSNPVSYSNQTNVSHFSFDNNSGQLLFSKQFTTSNLFNQGILSNVITDKSGITLASTSAPSAVVGTWTYPFNFSSYPNFAGIQLTWDTASYTNMISNSVVANKYATVSVSYDNGLTYYNVANGKTFPYFLSNYGSSFGGQCLIKVTMYSSDTSTGYQPRIDNLNISIYSDISEVSDSGLFQISPASSTTYMIKKDYSNILSRSKNLGIRFSAQDPGAKPGYAIISSKTSTSYQTVEFWMKYDGFGSAIMDTDVAGTADLWISSNVLQNSVSGSTLYVNGINRNSTPITLTNGEIYHVVLVYPTSKSTSILINGSYDGTKTPSEATYGYISIYPGTLTLSQVQSRYLSFVAVNTSVAFDSVTSIGSVIEYSGTFSQINNGQPITFHTHVS
jgi:hypothetical protein